MSRCLVCHLMDRAILGLNELIFFSYIGPEPFKFFVTCHIFPVLGHFYSPLLAISFVSFSATSMNRRANLEKSGSVRPRCVKRLPAAFSIASARRSPLFTPRATRLE